MPYIVAGGAAAIEYAADQEKEGVGLSVAAYQALAFKAFPHAMAEQTHERAARVRTFGSDEEVVDGVTSGGQKGGVR